ncbi:outer membrane efflux protein [Labilithrix luteola]|uniref:Outer membrane efflux protein n=1 Tax=Labilithrix luteola TaxID=1391654 RepID=A0A0K1Q3P1_9BACT|nr:TolC family protein [Labilithrix luteola]AKV00451.1 outer membrane efflux protein [Labilithrix luteola]
MALLSISPPLFGGFVVRDALALQPLDAFVASARERNPDNREAAAIERQRDAESDVATGKFLPSIAAQGTYTRNGAEAKFDIPNGGTLTIQALNALDGSLTLAVPIVDVAAWQRKRAATATFRAAGASRTNTQLTVEENVTRAYYELVGSEALVGKAKASLGYAEDNSRTVSDRKDLGTASELDVQRAQADVARARQELAATQQGLVDARRVLASLARLSPEPSGEALAIDDDLNEEPPVSVWLDDSRGGDLVPVHAAVANTVVAERNRTAARAAWLPTLSAQAQERFTNAGGFAGKNSVLLMSLTANWRFDLTLAPNVRAQSAALAAAQAREDKARRAAEDAVDQAWNQVHAGIEKARAARAELDSSTAALELARDRYQSGVATQIEVVQAQRDFFGAGVSHVQAVADLKYARALLRLSARRVTNDEGGK